MHALNRFVLGFAVLLTSGALLAARDAVKVAVTAAINPEATAASPAGSDGGTFAIAVAEFDQIGPLAALSAPISTTQLAAVVTQPLQDAAVGTLTTLDAAPDVVVVCHWGEIHPNGAHLRVRRPQGGFRPLMRAMLQGLDANFIPPIQRTEFQAAVVRERFFLVVTAYDGDALRDGQIVKLWQTRASADSLEAHPSTVWQALVQASAPHFRQALDRTEFALQQVPNNTIPETQTVAAAAEDVLPEYDLAIQRAIL